MIIKRLTLTEGMNKSADLFSRKSNLIFSKSNTKGKSTYLRLLFFALGYRIPNMKGINFNTVDTEIIVESKGNEYIILRDKNFLTVKKQDITVYFTLPSEHISFLSYLLDYNNVKVLKNLLGILYIDQDKGWSLLNRGTVIGKIKFNIEELLSGLNNVDIDTLLAQKSQLTLNKNKYLAMRNMKELCEEVYEQNGEIFMTDIEKEINDSIVYCNLKLKNLKDALSEIVSVINSEKSFFTYIDSMLLSVQKDGITIPVTSKTIVHSKSNQDYLNARKSVLATNIEQIKREKASYESKLEEFQQKNLQLSFLDNTSGNEIINKQLANLNIDQTLVENLLEKTQKDLSDVNYEIKRILKQSNDFITKIYNYVFKFAEMLDVEDKMVLKNDFIFTSDLKSMSGAVLQKMVFAFKLAFLKVIEEDIGEKLFMILDSPKGKELDDKNTEMLFNLIKIELSENQVFVASIYDFKLDKKIEIINQAIEMRKDT
ncbi:MAG: hypothetical protein PHE51_08950 [Eubacteriales bacterium]|nr:hypothetical protein [Eubacteriales bacterium]